MRYEDFIIQLSPSGNANFLVDVLQSPAGKGHGVFELPLDRDGLPLLRHRMDARIRDDSPDLGRSRPRSSTAAIRPRQVGETLFGALFSGRVLRLYERSLGKVGEHGLRIKLKLDPHSAERAWLQSLPWELLAPAGGGRYLGLSPVSSIVRYLDAPAAVPPETRPLRLRVLLAISQPTDLPSLDLEQQRRRLESLHGMRLKIVTLPRTDLNGLRRALNAERYHALHFIGHGTTDPVNGEGSLELMGRDGRSESIRGEVLASLLSESKSLRLVSLNACQTAPGAAAEAIGDDTPDEHLPFASIAQALVKSGIPAVVAMQREISDLAAGAFSEAFFRRIAAGDPVDAAMTQGRQAILDKKPRSLEWSTPALFMHAPNGVLFRKWASPRLAAVWLTANVFTAMHKKPLS